MDQTAVTVENLDDFKRIIDSQQKQTVISVEDLDQIIASQQKLLTIGGIFCIVVIVLTVVAAWAVVTGRICFTCFNRGYLPVFRKSSQMFDLRMACPSCSEA
jgi:E3 ubiquitin-protein ligase DOA10